MRKTSAIFVLILVGVAPISAAAPHHCDVDWLHAAQHVISQGGVPDDPKHYLTEKPVLGGQKMVFDTEDDMIEFMPKVCDKTIWEYIFKTEAGLGLGWREELPSQVRILLSVDALYYVADTRGAAVETDSTETLNEVLRAAVQSQLELSPTYAQLSDLQDEMKTDAAWASSAEGRAVAAQLEAFRKDAAATEVKDGPKGRIFWFRARGHMVRADTIDVRELKEAGYRRRLAWSLAEHILGAPLDPLVQTALTDYQRRHGISP